MHHKIDNTRIDFHFKQAHALCDVADMIFMEDLDYRVSAKGMLGKHMLDAFFRAIPRSRQVRSSGNVESSLLLWMQEGLLKSVPNVVPK